MFAFKAEDMSGQVWQSLSGALTGNVWEGTLVCFLDLREINEIESPYPLDIKIGQDNYLKRKICLGIA